MDLTTTNQKPRPVRLRGGLDTSNAPMSVPDGCVIGSENYLERVVEGGYSRVAGYERFDGRPWPSVAEVTALQGSPTWAAFATFGSIGVGAISGAQGVICYRSDTQLGLTKVSGTFTNGEQILVGGLPAGTADTSPSVDPLVLNEMNAGAEAIYSADIGEVPGSGPVRGVCVVAGEVFAFRDNAGGTAQDVYKATTSGWTAVPMYYSVRFTAGSATGFNSGYFGLTLTQGSATAMVRKIMIEDGDFATADAAGTMIISAPSGGSMASGLATVSGYSMFMTLSDAPAQVSLLPGGRWNFRPYRFSLVPSYVDETVFGVDRTDDGGGNFIEFDGATVIPIRAGGISGPWGIEAHKNHLFIVYNRTSIQFSGIGDPYQWTVLSGAGEMLAGQEVTALLSIPGSEAQAALLIMCRDRSFVLYGNSSSDFSLVPLSREVGAKKYSAQAFTVPIALDDQGMRSYNPTSAFGNFTFATLSNHVKDKLIGKTPTASVLDKDGGRYRIFFDDGTWMSGTPAKRWSWLFGRYPITVHFAQSWELDGRSLMFATATDTGYVYMLDRSRTFDGAAIEAWLKTNYVSFGTPWQRKAFKRMQIEIRGESAGSIYVTNDYSYGDSTTAANSAAEVVNSPTPPPATPWDLGQWDNGTWDSQYSTMLSVRSSGVGTSVSMTVYSNSNTEKPHHITTAVHYLIPRKQGRG